MYKVPNFETKTSTVIVMRTGAGVPKMMTYQTELGPFTSSNECRDLTKRWKTITQFKFYMIETREVQKIQREAKSLKSGNQGGGMMVSM